MPFKRNDRVEFDDKGTTIHGVVDKGGKAPKVVADGRKLVYTVPEGRLRMSSHPIPAEDRKALGLDGSAPAWKSGDRVMFQTRDGAIHGTVTRVSSKITVIQDGGANKWTVGATALIASTVKPSRDEPHEMDRYGLKGYRAYEAISEETIAFSAIVTYDGKPILEAKNDGHGGCNYYYPLQKADAGRADFEGEAKRWLLDMGMPEKLATEASDFWVSWKAEKAPYNVTARQEVADHVDAMRGYGLDVDEPSSPKP